MTLCIRSSSGGMLGCIKDSGGKNSLDYEIERKGVGSKFVGLRILHREVLISRWTDGVLGENFKLDEDNPSR